MSPQLPYEIWRPIFKIVYSTKSSISHPPSDFVISPLNGRLNVYRCLALVSRSWRVNSRDVFFEDLHALTADALKGIISTFQKDRHLALAVSRIRFCFWEFRCSASTPRRPRPLQPDSGSESEDTTSSATVPGTRGRPNWKMVHRRDIARYRPSNTAQGSHWTRWQADVGQILSMCTSLSDVQIISTNQSFSPYHYFSKNYLSWFAPPDLTNERVLDGLLHSANLRSLHLVDPTPLEMYGPALASWERLKHFSITLTRPYEELQDTLFVPPKSLQSLRFIDRSNSQFSWPLASDLGRCTNLQVLHLAVTSQRNENTDKAIGFLCTAYQHSLRELNLHMIDSRESGDTPSSFQDILQSVSPLHFTNLQRLYLPDASYDTSVFSYFNADELRYVEVGWLMLEPAPGSREDKWGRALRHPSLRGLNHLVINQNDPDDLRKQALNVVCERLGITLVVGQPYQGPGEHEFQLQGF